jgi:hypothetical protein
MLRNITFSAEETLIKSARKKAVKRNVSLNTLFRQWLRKLAADTKPAHYHRLMDRLDYVSSGGKFSRDEMNER